MVYICAKFHEIISNGIKVVSGHKCSTADGRMDGQTDGQTDGRTDTQKFGGYNIIPSDHGLYLCQVS